MIRPAKRALLALALCSCALPALAQPPAVQFPGGFAPGSAIEGWDTTAGQRCILGSSGTCTAAPGATSASATGVTSADASGTVTTANTYQTLQAANGARKGCSVQNTSTVAESVKVGATVFTLMPGQPLFCANGLTVSQDAVAITSAMAGASFSAAFQ